MALGVIRFIFMQYRIKPTWLHLRWTTDVGFPVVEEFLFSVPPSADQLLCQLPYIQLVPWAPSTRSKRPDCKTHHSLLSRAEVNIAWCSTFIPIHTFIRGVLSYTASELCTAGLLHGISIVPTSNTGIIWQRHWEGNINFKNVTSIVAYWMKYFLKTRKKEGERKEKEVDG
jgi:hypothetical protein